MSEITKISYLHFSIGPISAFIYVFYVLQCLAN
jgi:hypothetical protein